MLVKSVTFLPASIKSMDGIQKYPHTTELFAYTRKMLAIMFFYFRQIFELFLNAFRNMFNNKTIEINNFTSVTK